MASRGEANRRRAYSSRVCKPRFAKPQAARENRIPAGDFRTGSKVEPRLTIGFIGAGALGTALAGSLARRGWRIGAVASRTYASAKKLTRRIPGCRAYANLQDAVRASDLVFITTPDDAIENLCASMDWRAGQIVAHTSGACSIRELEAARRQGALTGTFHPLGSYPGRNNQALWPTFGIEGESRAFGILKAMARSLGARILKLRFEDKAAYHAGACLAGHSLTLLALAAQLWRPFVPDRRRAVSHLFPIVQTIMENVSKGSLADALAGPVSRGDAGSVLKHLAAIRRQMPEILPVYRELARLTIPLALEKGTLTPARAQELRSVFSGNRLGKFLEAALP